MNNRATDNATDNGRERGFSLIEILVVLAIISLLMGVVAVGALRFQETGRITDCHARLEAIGLLVESYHDRQGVHPPSKLEVLGIKVENKLNEGCEALVAALRARDYGGRRPNERWLGNVDGDSVKGHVFADGSTALLELLDPWDNPIVYVASGDYGTEFSYRFDMAGDQIVIAERNPLTGGWHQFEGYQLLSAGPDGLPGTEDDLANYDTGRDSDR